MKDQVLSIEQMNILISKGVDASKASMMWISFYDTLYITDSPLELRCRDNILEDVKQCAPTFTVADIMEMLPNRINNKEYPDGDKFNLRIQRLLFDNDNWLLSFILGDVVEYDCKGSLKDIAYETILWLLDNNHKLNNQI